MVSVIFSTFRREFTPLRLSESSVTLSLRSYTDGIYIVSVTLNGESEA